MDKPKPNPLGPDASDVHGIEVREGLMLVFHRPEVPGPAAIASVRARVGFDHDIVSIEVSAEKIRELEEAMMRADGDPTDRGPIPLVDPARHGVN